MGSWKPKVTTSGHIDSQSLVLLTKITECPWHKLVMLLDVDQHCNRQSHIQVTSGKWHNTSVIPLWDPGYQLKNKGRFQD